MQVAFPGFCSYDQGRRASCQIQAHPRQIALRAPFERLGGTGPELPHFLLRTSGPGGGSALRGNPSELIRSISCEGKAVNDIETTRGGLFLGSFHLTIESSIFKAHDCHRNIVPRCQPRYLRTASSSPLPPSTKTMHTRPAALTPP